MEEESQSNEDIEGWRGVQKDGKHGETETCTSSAAFSRLRWVSRASRSRRVRSTKSCFVSCVRDLFLPANETCTQSNRIRFDSFLKNPAPL